MSAPVLMLLDYVDKTIAELGKCIRKDNLTRIKVEYEKLAAFSDCVESLLPEEFVETVFPDYDRHLDFIGYYIQRRNFEYIESNFDDLAENDIPNIKPRIYDLLEKSKLPERKVATSRNIFIVHGRANGPVRELKTILSEFGFNPIVLHEQPSGSRTIVEKLEKYSDVGYAFVILTPDDFGSQMESLGGILSNPDGLDIEVVFDSKLVERRARQNVVLEFGYFIGLLSRDRVCCLHTGDVELPSDMHGIVYIPFGKSVNDVRDKIIKELRAAGYTIKV